MKMIRYTYIAFAICFVHACTVIKSTADNGDQNKKDTIIHPELLKLEEVDEAHNSILVAKDFKVIDVNSTVRVKINTTELAKRFESSTLNSGITTQLKNLTTMVAAEKKAIQSVQDALVLYANDPNGKAWNNKLGELRKFLLTIDTIPEFSEIYNSLIRGDESIIQQYQLLFKTATIAIGKLEDKIKTLAEKNGVYVQLGAWLENKTGTTPINIPHFDTYSPQPVYTVERYKFNLSEEQKTEIANLSKFANDANKDGLMATLKAHSDIDNLLKGLLNLSGYKELITLKEKLELLAGKPAETLASLKPYLTNSSQLIKTYENFIKNMVQGFSSLSAGNDPEVLLRGIAGNMEELISKTKELKAGLIKEASAIRNDMTATGNEVTANLKLYANQFEQIGINLETQVNTFQKNIADMLPFFKADQEISARTFTFTEKVKKLSLTDATEEGVIDLTVAGKRDESDVLIIKLATGKPGETVIEQSLLRYHLYFCSLYVKTVTGLLFVNPAPILQKVPDQPFTRFSASYSFLAKGIWRSATGSRTNLRYHSSSPGIGVNIALLNFNPNGTTELGLGAVYSTLKDFIQAGAGFNTVSGSGYIFLGIKIPVGALTFK